MSNFVQLCFLISFIWRFTLQAFAEPSFTKTACAVIGGFNEGGQFSNMSWQACKNLCSVDDKCKSFDWREKTGYNCAVSYQTRHTQPEAYKNKPSCSNDDWSYNEKVEGECYPEPDRDPVACKGLYLSCNDYATNNCANCQSFWKTACPTLCNYCPPTTTKDPNASTPTTTITSTTTTIITDCGTVTGVTWFKQHNDDVFCGDWFQLEKGCIDRTCNGNTRYSLASAVPRFTSANTSSELCDGTAPWPLSGGGNYEVKLFCSQACDYCPPRTMTPTETLPMSTITPLQPTNCTPKADSKPSDCKQVPSKCKDSECSIPGCVWWRSICPTTCNYCQAATATSTTMNDPVVSTSTATTTTSTTKAIDDIEHDDNVLSGSMTWVLAGIGVCIVLTGLIISMVVIYRKKSSAVKTRVVNGATYHDDGAYDNVYDRGGDAYDNPTFGQYDMTAYGSGRQGDNQNITLESVQNPYYGVDDARIDTNGGDDSCLVEVSNVKVVDNPYYMEDDNVTNGQTDDQEIILKAVENPYYGIDNLENHSESEKNYGDVEVTNVKVTENPNFV